MSDTPVEQAPPAVAPAPVAAPTPEVTPAPVAAETSSPEFNWTGWDGSADSLPEDYRKVGSKVADWYKSANNDNEEELGTLRAMYSAMLDGEEDPRVKQYHEELQKLKTEYEQRNTAFSELEQNYEALTQSSVNEYVDRFWKDHPELADNEEKLETFSKFLEEQNDYGGAWDGYQAAKLMELPEDAIAIAVQAKKDGVSDTYALKLAQAHNQVQSLEAKPSTEDMAKAVALAEAKEEAKKPRPAAKLTNGATGAARPQVAKKSMGDAKSFDEMRSLAAARALRVHSGGKQ
jgi:hypothetical protein|tara:strand:- start:1881 stop:2750 length:870 start_codon:yes stop_codon:yes gene_type:complete